MSIEAMKQALEALSYVMSHGAAVRQAKDILLEAIEQAEKPIAQVQVAEDYYAHVIWLVENPVQFDHQYLYTAPPQREWVGLTDQEVHKIEISASSKEAAIYLAEAQLKGKNA
jgi:hypothetical protein